MNAIPIIFYLARDRIGEFEYAAALAVDGLAIPCFPEHIVFNVALLGLYIGCCGKKQEEGQDQPDNRKKIN
jgi:hypothetical protein